MEDARLNEIASALTEEYLTPTEPQPDPDDVIGEKSTVLRMEIMSAKGLHLESTEKLLKVQAHVLFDEGVSRSTEMLPSTENDVVFNYTVDYELDDRFRRDHVTDDICPIVIYITTSVAIVPKSPYDQAFPVGSDQSKTLVAMAVIDFRLTYVHSNQFMSVELMPCELEGIDASIVGPGILYVKLCILENKKIAEAPFAATDIVNEQISKYQMRLSQGCYDNYQRARSWWAMVRRDFPWVDSRQVKLIAEDEAGQQRFVCSFVYPIQPPRGLESARQTARFVSLIPFRRSMSLTGGRVTKWKSPMSFLSTKQGDAEDHAVLLCSLLLGWGMDAWVALGKISVPSKDVEDAHKPHCWVVTLDAIHEHRIVFWEALTGQQYEVLLDAQMPGYHLYLPSSKDTVPANLLQAVHQKHVDVRDSRASDASFASMATPSKQQQVLRQLHDQRKQASHPFQELHALFRHDCFMLNTQRSASLQRDVKDVLAEIDPLKRTAPKPAMSMDMHDANCWAKFEVQNYSLLRHTGSCLRINDSIWCTDSARRTELDLEVNIREMIVQWRLELGLQTRFDDRLSQALTPVLMSYELDRAAGATVASSNADFQCSVKRLVEKGQCFKAYPTCFAHIHYPSIEVSLKRTSTVRDIVTVNSAAGGHARAALGAFGRRDGTLGAHSVASVGPKSGGRNSVAGGGVTGGAGLSRFGVRVKLHEYPEGLCALWVMIAVCYYED
jgi:hypothetical protein